MLRYIHRKINRITCTALALLLLFPIRSHAAVSAVLPLQPENPDVVSIELPTVREGEEAPFDFFLDPQGLLYATQAARYGGGTVEEGATLYFRNREGEYGFSGDSDRLTVTNRSTVPAVVTVTASIDNLGDLLAMPDGDFSGSSLPAVYLALVDDRGNVLPLSADGAVSLTLEMAAAPESAYVYRLDEASQSYTYGLSADPSQIAFDTYAFGLTGACNPDADWEDIAVNPVVTVTWKVEPVMPETEEETTQEETTEPETEETAKTTETEETEEMTETETARPEGTEQATRESGTSGETRESAATRAPETGTGAETGQETKPNTETTSGKETGSDGHAGNSGQTAGSDSTGADRETGDGTVTTAPGADTSTTAGSPDYAGESQTSESTDRTKETEPGNGSGSEAEPDHGTSSPLETTPAVVTEPGPTESHGTEAALPSETVPLHETETTPETEPAAQTMPEASVGTESASEANREADLSVKMPENALGSGHAGRTGTLVEQERGEPEGQARNE